MLCCEVLAVWIWLCCSPEVGNTCQCAAKYFNKLLQPDTPHYVHHKLIALLHCQEAPDCLLYNRFLVVFTRDACCDRDVRSSPRCGNGEYLLSEMVDQSISSADGLSSERHIYSPGKTSLPPAPQAPDISLKQLIHLKMIML